MKKLLFIIALLLCVILSGCATQQFAQNYSKKQSLMLLKNTELNRNIKYYKQRHNRYNKHDFNSHIKSNKIKN